MHLRSEVHFSTIFLNTSKYQNIGITMSAGLEIRGKSMRIWMKPISTEPPIKETLDWPFTPENAEKAKKLAGLI